MADKKYREVNGAYISKNEDRHVVMFSAGIDSTTTAAILKSEGKNPLLLFVNTGGDDMEYSLKQAEKISKEMGLELIISNDLLEYCKRTAVGTNIYIPWRNLLFAILGATYGKYVYIAGIKGDFSPDKTPEVFQAFKDVINLSAGPLEKVEFLDSILWNKDKIEVAKTLAELGYGHLIKDILGCYHPHNGKHCGNCIACFRKYIMLKEIGEDTEGVFEVNPLEGEGGQAYKEMAKSGEWHENIPLETVLKYVGE